MAQFAFFFFAAVAIFAAVAMLVARNPVSSALWLVLNLFCVAGVYLTMNATFLGAVQILIYAGAIMVLFLFVIMLLNLSALPTLEDISWGRVVAFLLGMMILAQLMYVVAIGLDVPIEPADPEVAAQTGDAAEIARPLFTEFALHLEMMAILLLAATVGAIMLAKRRFE